jgi:hypothetical protein
MAALLKKQCYGSEIQDLVPFLTPGSGIRDGKIIRIRIRDEQPGSYFRELKKQYFGLKYLNFFMRIRAEKNSDPG